MRLLLARHGNTFGPGDTPFQVGSKTDLPLVESGRAQAQALGEALCDLPIAAIYSGSLRRQRETAEIAARAMGYTGELLTTEALNEIDYGPWEGKTGPELIEGWPEAYTEWQERGTWPKGLFGGSEGEVREGLEGWFAALKERYPSDAVILGVGSGGVIRLLDPERRKVSTGHLCDFLLGSHLEVRSWNLAPEELPASG
ncbi:MAG: histidine phosphatase family protein [Parachlamydiales bacterium]